MGLSAVFTQLDQAYACVRVGADGTSDGSAAVGPPAGDANSYRTGRANATARTAPGVYTVTLLPGVDRAEIHLSPLVYGGTTGDEIFAELNADEVTIDVTTFSAGEPADLNWGLMVRKVRSAQ